MCVLWPLPSRYDLGPMSWHTLGSLTTIVWNIIQIQHGSEELWPGHRFWGMCAQWPWPWRYDLGSRSWHTLGSQTTIVWNIIQIRQRRKKICLGYHVNRRTDRVIPIYPNFVCGGMNIIIALHMLIQVFKHRIHPGAFFSSQALFSMTDAAWCHKFLKIG